MAIASTKPRQPAARPRVVAREAIPAYGVPDGVLSFRHGLRARERGAIDRALEILNRVLCQREVFTTPDAVKHYLQLHLAGEKCERFAVLYLDSQNRLIAFENHFTGTLTQVGIYPREIVRAALAHHAAAVVLTHNHPSGVVDPSPADVALTQTLRNALALVDVRVLDHVIVAPGAVLSMAERGLMGGTQPAATTEPTPCQPTKPTAPATATDGGAVTLSGARRRACLEAAWELDALARILPSQVPHVDDLQAHHAVRGIAGRMLRLSKLLMEGLDENEKCVPTADLERIISLDSGQG